MSCIPILPYRRDRHKRSNTSRESLTINSSNLHPILSMHCVYVKFHKSVELILAVAFGRLKLLLHTQYDPLSNDRIGDEATFCYISVSLSRTQRIHSRRIPHSLLDQSPDTHLRRKTRIEMFGRKVHIAREHR
jgi:hypothetical protein